MVASLGAQQPAGVSSPARVRAVRWVSSAHLTALIVQFILALTFLAGRAEAFALHRANAWLVLALGGLQALAGLAVGPRRAGLWLTAALVAIPLLEGLQIVLGRAVQTHAHVLVGFALWSAAVVAAVRVWTSSWPPEAPRAP